MTAHTDDDVTADHGPLAATGVRCPDCGWPVPPEHDAAIAARALRKAAGEIDLSDFWEVDQVIGWLRARAGQVNP